MTTRTFALRTEPHEARVGDHVLLFVPEVNGAAFLQSYAKLRDAQSASKGKGKDAEVTAESLAAADAAIREFLASVMLEESREAFASLELPTRILVEMLEWVAELYGGGAKARPTG